MPPAATAVTMDGMAADGEPTTPLIGRGPELARLRDVLGIGGEPRSAVVVLGGDAGVGKTRVLRELATIARDAGWRVLVGHCIDFGDSALPYLPFTELFGGLGEQEDLALPSIRHQPALARLLPGERLLGEGPDERLAGGTGPGHAGAGGPSPDRLPEGGTRGELFVATHAVLEQLALGAPVLVLVEDVHWADPSTRDLLTFLFTRRFTGPIGIVVTYRTDDLHRRHPLRAALAEWGRLPAVERLQLGSLPPQDIRALVHALEDGVPARDVEEIVERADGNAFFAEELVGARTSGRGHLPAELADLMLVRLDRLDDDARAVVRVAAAAGRRVDHETLAVVAGLDARTLETAVRALVEANLLVASPTGSYAFRHALLAEAVEGDLLPGERTRLHAAYAAALHDGRIRGTAAELARHARAAHDLPTAVVASIDAGDEAMAVGGPTEAAQHYQTALELLAEPRVRALVDVDVSDLTVRAAEAVTAAGDSERAVELLRARLAETEDTATESRARLLIAHARASLITEEMPLHARESTQRALALLGPEPSLLRAQAISVHARVSAVQGSLDEAVQFAQEAIEMARELGDQRIAAEAATTLGRLKEFAGDPESSMHELTRVVAEIRESGDLPGLIRGLHQLGGTHLELGHLREALDMFLEAHVLAQQCRRPWAPYAVDSWVLAGLTAYMLGDWAEVDTLTDLSGMTPPPAAEPILASVRLLVAAGRGDPGAPALAERLHAGWSGDTWIVIFALGPTVDALGDRGEVARAIELYREGRDLVRERWHVPVFHAEVRFGAVLLGQLAAAAGHASLEERRQWVALGEEARDAAAQVRRRLAEEGRTSGPEGNAWQDRLHAEYLRLRWVAGIDPPGGEELVAAWRRAVEGFVALGAAFETARSRARLAAALRATGDVDGATDQAALARDVAERLGALPLLDEVRDLTATPPTAGNAPRAHGDALTPRELEVLALVAEGRTNGEIARRLFISTKTVSVHVSNILAKLGASGRTEAAALARRRGLL